MNRRKFIKILLYLSSLHLAFGNRLVSAGKKKSGNARKIIVIGAGIAGLAAASHLNNSGFQVKILEARNRTGGRVWTNHSMGMPVDMGASWIHGVNGNPIKKIADQLDLKTSRTDYDNVTVFDHTGKQLDEASLEEIAESFEELIYEIEQYSETLSSDTSIGHALNRILEKYQLTPEETYAMNYALMSVIVDAAAELDELSLWYADQDEGFGGGDKLFPGGYDQIVSHLARQLDIQLNAIVTGIEHSATGIKITTPENTYTADAAIVTVPLGVLKSGNIRFMPDLPKEKQLAINKLGMGVINKVALQFPATFWSNKSEFIGNISSNTGEFPMFLNLAYYTKHPVLLAFAGAGYARAMEKQTDEQIKNNIMKILRNAYGQSLPEPVKILISRWRSDPFALGSYSHIPVGATGKDYDLLAEPLEHKRLLFAGEATMRQYPATVHGAYLSGIREAKRIQTMRF